MKFLACPIDSACPKRTLHVNTDNMSVEILPKPSDAYHRFTIAAPTFQIHKPFIVHFSTQTWDFLGNISKLSKIIWELWTFFGTPNMSPCLVNRPNNLTQTKFDVINSQLPKKCQYTFLLWNSNTLYSIQIQHNMDMGKNKKIWKIHNPPPKQNMLQVWVHVLVSLKFGVRHEGYLPTNSPKPHIRKFLM